MLMSLGAEAGGTFLLIVSLQINPCGVRKLPNMIAQSVERDTSGEEVLGSIPAVAARSLLVRSVSV